MSVSRKKAWEYAEQVLGHPGRHKEVVIRNGKQGVTVLHEGRVLTRCYATKVGVMAAPLVAEALGVELPPPRKRDQNLRTYGGYFQGYIYLLSGSAKAGGVGTGGEVPGGGGVPAPQGIGPGRLGWWRF